ncbi:MAG: hypothetical protein R3F56_22715 [Planctomycetota bacterium]
MKITPFLPLALAFTPSCIGMSVGTDSDEFFRMRGFGTAYAAMPGIDDYDGKIIRVGLLSRSPAGAQLAGIEVWPLFSVGVGLVGARVRVLPFEIGAGLLFYHPKAVRRDLTKNEEKAKPAVHNDVHDAGDVPIQPVDASGGEPGGSDGAGSKR